MEWLKDALIARQGKELSEQWRSAGSALLQLLQDEQTLASIPAEAAWTLLNGVQTSLRGMERAVRTAREHSLPVDARRTLGELTYALNSVRDVLERFVVPGAEKLYGPPPVGTRWQMELVEKERP